MLISTPNFSSGNAGTLTPTMIRGAFLVWRSELQLGKQSAEIRELDRNSTPEQFTSGASANPSGPIRELTRRSLQSWGDDLRGTLGWEEGSSLR
jgi:hypothetical protein